MSFDFYRHWRPSVLCGEQKRRSCIIPLTLGFDRETYIYAKFLVLPTLAFLLSFLGYLTAYGVSSLLFSDFISFPSVLPAAFALAMFMAFQICLFLCIGCSTGKAGIAVAAVYLTNTLLSLILSTLDKNYYNPWALLRAAGEFEVADPGEYAVCFGSAIALSFVCAVVTAARFKHRKML